MRCQRLSIANTPPQLCDHHPLIHTPKADMWASSGQPECSTPSHSTALSGSKAQWCRERSVWVVKSQIRLLFEALSEFLRWNFWFFIYKVVNSISKCGVKTSMGFRWWFSDVRAKCSAFQRPWQHRKRSWQPLWHSEDRERPQRKQQSGLESNGHGLSPAKEKED